jgi:multidrug resistance efflux pump
MQTQDNIYNKSISEMADLDHNLWNEFIASQGHDEYFYNWVKVQCALIPGVSQCVLFLADEKTGAFSPVSRWPESGEDPERLSEIAERVIDQKCGLLLELNLPADINQSSLKRYGIGYPFFIQEKLQGLVVLEIQAGKESQLTAAMSQLQWGSGWLELFFRRRQTQKDEHLLKKMKSAVDLMALVLAEESFKGAAMAFVTQLALFLECDRVSLAFIKNNHSRIQAVSHSAQIEQRMNLNRAIELAMDEAVTQRKDLLYPPPADKEINIVRNHEQLARQYGAGCIFTMPFYGDGRYYGALTLERPDKRPFTLEEVEISHSIGALIFPVLEAKRQNDRNLFFKTLDSLKTQFMKFTGEGYAGRKTLALLMAVLVIFFSFMKWDYRVSGNTSLEGKVRRSVVAPLEGYINEAFVRAGDTVEEGAVMCTLDDRDLRLERLNIISRQNQYQKQYQESVAGHKRADSEIIKAQLDQSAAQLELIEGEIKRTRITAPFKGLILSGDLSQRLGGSAQKGEVLFEIAPLDSYRMILDIDERHIGDIKPGQQGRAILSALPDQGFGFIVDKITPLSNPKEGKNYFRVEATVKDASERLRPGMTGVGKIYVGRRKLVDVLTRDLIDWLRIKAWAWRP